MQEEISRDAQLLKFFAQAHGRRGVPRKRLVKLAYMADVLARQYLGHPLSSFVYLKDHFGPNVRELPDVVLELENADLAEQTTERDGGRRTIRLRDTGRPIAFGFSLGENEILSYVTANYLEMDLEEFITDVVKTTDPFQAASLHGERLPMERVNDEKRREVGFDLEKILRAEREVAEGHYSTLADFADELYSDIAARHSERDS